jgi:DNA-binding PadR family transcriptional regulator
MFRHHNHHHHCPRGHGHGHGSFFGRFGGRGPGAGFGPGMRAAKMLASGDLQLVILALLDQKPRHGYEIIKALQEHSSGIYTPSPGMVYPALAYLEETGFAASVTEGTKKLFSITDAGKGELSGKRATADQTLSELARFGEKMARFRQQVTEDENAADDFGGGRTSEAKGEWRQMKAEFRGLRDELKAAIYEKLDATLEEKQRILGVLRRAIDEIRGR